MTIEATQIPGSSPPQAELPQPAGATAALAWQMAPDTCRGCADYHGIYPLLHALGLAAAPDRHAAFYADALGSLASTGEYTRVLVTGSADHGMPEHVLRAYQLANAGLELEMLDLCPTPGLLCMAWADSVGIDIQTHACNILQWRPERQFDMIACHSFIAKFGPNTRANLFAAWADLLRPGGRLVTTARIDSDVSEASAGFSAAKAAAFADTLVTTAQPWLHELGIDANELHAAAIRHCDDIASYPISSVEELRELLESNGFVIDSLELVEHQGRLSGKSSGAGTHRTARYADFVAFRS